MSSGRNYVKKGATERLRKGGGGRKTSAEKSKAKEAKAKEAKSLKTIGRLQRKAQGKEARSLAAS